MVLQNPKRFGLDVNSNFSDVLNKNLSLQALNLPPLDLEIIRGSQDAGAQAKDFRSFSRLKQPIWKNLDRYYSDSRLYDSLVSSKAGTDLTLFGNLTINGSIDGNSVRYRYVDFDDNIVKIADISTSRSSAWSSSDPRANSTDLIKQGRAKISYGARVGIATGGKLVFGAQHTAASPADPDLPAVTGPRLGTTTQAIEKEFDAEIPTHKIEVNINGSAIKLYAMKGIPLIFEGTFRNLNAQAKITQIGQIKASWKIIEVDNPNRYSIFENQGEVASDIAFRSSRTRRRYIQFYYNPDNITSLKIPSAGIADFPIAVLQTLKSLDLSFNKIRDLPNLTFAAPNLETITLQRCPLYQSSIEAERNLQNSSYSGGVTTGTVLDKLPTTIKNLSIKENFYGSITQNIIADRFTNLVTLDLSRSFGSNSQSPFFHPDTTDSNCQIPNVSSNCKTYNIRNNDFRSFDDSANGTTRFNITQLTDLETLDFAGNSRLPTVTSQRTALDFSNSTKIKTIDLSYTDFVMPTGLQNKTSLLTVSFRHGQNVGVIADNSGYSLNGCAGLTSIDLAYSNLNDSRLPIFNNESITNINLYNSRIKGGRASDDNEDFVIHKETFASAPELTNLTIRSNRLLTNTSIHPEAFIDNPKLYYLYYLSFRRTNGNIPSFASNPRLYYVYMHYNNLSGILPNFASNPDIYYARFSYNKLTGTIPGYKNLTKLRYLLINNNQFSAVNDPENLPKLEYYYAHNNQLSGEIPDLSECPRLRNLILFNNSFTNYKTGSLATSYYLRYLDVTNNNLSQQALAQLFTDLLTNYNNANRGGVTINVRQNTAPSADTLLTIDLLKSKGWNITND